MTSTMGKPPLPHDINSDLWKRHIDLHSLHLFYNEVAMLMQHSDLSQRYSTKLWSAIQSKMNDNIVKIQADELIFKEMVGISTGKAAVCRTELTRLLERLEEYLYVWLSSLSVGRDADIKNDVDAHDDEFTPSMDEATFSSASASNNESSSDDSSVSSEFVDRHSYHSIAASDSNESTDSKHSMSYRRLLTLPILKELDPVLRVQIIQLASNLYETCLGVSSNMNIIMSSFKTFLEERQGIVVDFIDQTDKSLTSHTQTVQSHLTIFCQYFHSHYSRLTNDQTLLIHSLDKVKMEWQTSLTNGLGTIECLLESFISRHREIIYYMTRQTSATSTIIDTLSRLLEYHIPASVDPQKKKQLDAMVKSLTSELYVIQQCVNNMQQDTGISVASTFSIGSTFTKPTSDSTKNIDTFSTSDSLNKKKNHTELNPPKHKLQRQQFDWPELNTLSSILPNKIDGKLQGDNYGASSSFLDLGYYKNMRQVCSRRQVSATKNIDGSKKLSTLGQEESEHVTQKQAELQELISNVQTIHTRMQKTRGEMNTFFSLYQQLMNRHFPHINQIFKDFMLLIHQLNPELFHHAERLFRETFNLPTNGTVEEHYNVCVSISEEWNKTEQDFVQLQYSMRQQFTLVIGCSDILRDEYQELLYSYQEHIQKVRKYWLDNMNITFSQNNPQLVQDSINNTNEDWVQQLSNIVSEESIQNMQQSIELVERQNTAIASDVFWRFIKRFRRIASLVSKIFGTLALLFEEEKNINKYRWIKHHIGLLTSNMVELATKLQSQIKTKSIKMDQLSRLLISDKSQPYTKIKWNMDDEFQPVLVHDEDNYEPPKSSTKNIRSNEITNTILPKVQKMKTELEIPSNTTTFVTSNTNKVDKKIENQKQEDQDELEDNVILLEPAEKIVPRQKPLDFTWIHYDQHPLYRFVPIQLL